MPISKFKSDYSGLLRDARAGQLQQISAVASATWC